ncbi:MAG: hypothetical protein J6U14_05370 [Bacteroidaceae bacterium]|nr:hypothetical protein [Bacteroidaceae bacterium]
MKKVFMNVALVAAIAAGYMITSSNKSEMIVSELTQANVEALAQSVDFGPWCANTKNQPCVLPDITVVGEKLEEPYQ